MITSKTTRSLGMEYRYRKRIEAFGCNDALNVFGHHTGARQLADPIFGGDFPR